MVKLLFSSYLPYPKSTRFEGEDKDESVLYLLRQSFVKNLDWIFSAVLIVFAPSILTFMSILLDFDYTMYFSDSFLLVSYLFWNLFTFGFIFVNFLNWFFNAYLITNKRIVDMDFHGILYRNISEAPLRNIEDITHKMKGVASTIFNYGDVIIQTAGEQREFDFCAVPNPIKVHDIISDLVSEEHNANRNNR